MRAGKWGTTREVTGRGAVVGPRKSGTGRRVGKRGEKVGPRKRAEVRGKGEREVGRDLGLSWVCLGLVYWALGFLFLFYSISKTNKQV